MICPNIAKDDDLCFVYKQLIAGECVETHITHSKDVAKLKHQDIVGVITGKARKKLKNSHHKNNSNDGNCDDMCCICMEREVDSVFVPCGHLKCCLECGLTQNRCPICRENVENAIKFLDKYETTNSYLPY